MDVLIRLLLLLLTPILFIACSQVEYLTKQGHGQMRLLWGATANQQVLAAKQLSDEQKQKIRLIEGYRDYFYRYWQEKPRDTYLKYYQLPDEAVSYLVILSPSDRVEAIEHCFPLAGCFPYLGFFDQQDALAFSREKEQQGKVSWVRPVYAYSTLGYFDDPILSSFFHYDELELAQLIFHELFHTIFFIEDEVELNENVANFVADRMVEIYFSTSKQNQEKLEHYLNRRHWENQGLKQLVSFALSLDAIYQANDRSRSHQILQEFRDTQIAPWVEKYCQGIEKCWAKELEYNNASLAAYLTYESQDEQLARWYQSHGKDLSQFVGHLRKVIKNYQKSGKKVELLDYLKAEL